MVHLNSNRLCAVEIRTYGPIVGRHGIFQIAVVPLNSKYQPEKGADFFYTNFAPYDKDDYDPNYVSKDELIRGVQFGIPAMSAADVFVRWFDKLNMPTNKLIMPLAHDWASKAEFLKEWLEPERFDVLFHKSYRCLLAASLAVNDQADMRVERIPFPKNDFRYICTTLGVVIDVRWDCLSQAIATAEAYSRLLRRMYHVPGEKIETRNY